ncbi:MAG: patatin-like phospholipase family protein [Rhizomicrobium sp.]|nr:patatin-like phospholipase family protein [Rhizomicrobium sp.]
MSKVSRLAALALCLALCACAYPTRNQPLASSDPTYGYRWNALGADDMPETLVIVSASGGGTRAALLALSTLKGMNQIALPNHKSLADEVDIISSVSGGSVTAGYFAAQGPAKFDTLEQFLRQDGMSALAWQYFNPVGLVKLATPHTERIDPLIDRFDQYLFSGATFESLKGRRPFLILNASDMVEGVPFALTQGNFDLICSDLSKFKLATGVAASAAFPIAMSPVTLTNYSSCPAQKGLDLAWPGLGAGSNWYDNSEAVAHGRVAKAYLDGRSAPHPKDYIHLLDGGITDNLGIAEPYRMLTTTEVTPSLLNEIGNGHIKRIVYVVVNARSAAKSGLDQQQATPGVFDMLMGTVDAGIDRSSLGSFERLKALLQSELEAAADDADDAKAPELAARYRFVSAHTHFATVDFDAISDSDCRDNFHSIATSWTLPQRQIDALLQVGQALLVQDPAFQQAVTDLDGKPSGAIPTVAQACTALRLAE